MPRYVTADAVAGIPTLADVPADQHKRVLDDAGNVLAYITDHQWSTDGELRKAFETQGWAPDRLNLALGLLRDLGQVLVLEQRHHDLLTDQAT